MEFKRDCLLDGLEILRQDNSDVEGLIGNRVDLVVSLLQRYVKEIELFNGAYGLVSVNNTDELIIRHILDSLAPLRIILRLLDEKSGIRIADAGSGAGLPGIPLAIALPDCEFTLIEKMGRRAGFLLNTKAVLGLSNVIIEEGELEKTAPGQFDLVTFRAFKPLEPKLLKTLFRACRNEGIIAAYKGRREKIEAETAPLEKLYEKLETIAYTTPFLDEERHLVVIRPKQ